MIKRIQLSDSLGLLHVLAGRVAAAGDDAPLRAAACRVLHHVAGSAAPHNVIMMEWFEDLSALHRYEARVGRSADSVLVCEERVLRGADWLGARWRDATPKYKHMALARRAAGLSAAEFSERWRNRPGRIGGSAATEIPAAARGHAYVQNHPLYEALYDAVNEVYFDDLDAMRSRIAFFADHNVAQADADLVSEAFFAVVEERLV